MQLILRVIDFVTDNFEESRDMAWAKQINEVLFDCKLGVRILLTKLILNRPKLFVQQCWGKHLLTYLIQENTGGQGLHYFFRDAVKLLIGFMTRVADRFVPELSQLNRLIAYVVKNLAHDNTHIYTDNIVILEQLLKVEGACVEKGLLITMLKSGGVRDFVKVEDEIGVQHDIIEKGEKIERTKSKFVDRLAAVLVLKACCLLRVPVLAQEEYLEAYSAPNQFQFLFDLHRLGLLAPITELIKEAKKHRIAAAGFLGEYLAFIFWSEQTHKLKEETFRLIAKFISSLIEKESNRAAR